jgi:pantothenate synthetase
LQEIREIAPGQTLLAVAVWVDQVRLIDNLVL